VPKERPIPVPPYAPQIPCAMPMNLCDERVAAKHMNCDIAIKLITWIVIVFVFI